MIKILIADDHDMVRMGLTRMLADHPNFNVVGGVATGEEAVSQAKKLMPDVVLMDINMPGIGGLEATKKIIAYNSEVKIIGVTAVNDGLFPDRFLKAGAFGYVTKESGFDEIVRAINKVMSGRQYIGIDIAQKMAINKLSGGEESPFNLLSQRELQTVLMVVKGDKVADIADYLNVEPKTVNTYRYRIFEKMNINSDVELVHMAIKYNLIVIE